MSLYRRKHKDPKTGELVQGKIWLMEFRFRGALIRESTGMTSKTRAREVYDKRRMAMKTGAQGIKKEIQPLLLSAAAKEWRETRAPKWAPSTVGIVDCALGHLLPVLGKKLMVDLEARDVAKYQKVRQTQNASGRTINIEVGILRQILRKYGKWARIGPDVTMLPERQDVGRALAAEEESTLLVECSRSRSRNLLPFVCTLLYTGARFNTVRMLRWADIDFAAPHPYIRFGKDKTKTSSNRNVRMSARLIDILKGWAANFPDRLPEHYVFPLEQYAGSGRDETFGFTVGIVRSSDPRRPTASIQGAWESMKLRTRRHCPECRTGTLADCEKPMTGYFCVDCGFVTEELPAGLVGVRLHDLRHTAVSRMIQARVPLPKIARVVGWSASTMAHMSMRYGHFGIEDQEDAVEAITSQEYPAISTGSPLKSPQAGTTESGLVN